MKTGRHLTAVFFICMLILFHRCANSGHEEPVVPDETKYYVVNNIPSSLGPPRGNISTFKNPGSVLVDNAYTLNITGVLPDAITDAAIDGEKIYIARSVSPVVDVVTLSSLLVEGTLTYAKTSTGNYNKHLIVGNNKVIVADRGFVSGSFNDASFLKIIHLDNPAQVDSIPVVQNAPVWALGFANNRIFVSAGDPQVLVYVFDAVTNVKLGTIDVGGLCFEMINDNDGSLLAFTRTRMSRIDPVTNSVTSTKALFFAATNVNFQYTSCASPVALDGESRILYYLVSAAQPAPAPYLLYSYNFNTDVSAQLGGPNFISAETILFDKKNKLIVLASATSSGGTVKFMAKTGEIFGQFALKNSPLKLLIKQ